MNKFFGFFLFCWLIWMSVNVQAAPREILYVFDDAYPPHTFVEEGKCLGFDIDVLKAALEGADVSVIYRPMQWGDAQEMLKKGEAHLSSGMAQTEERKKMYLFPRLPISEFKVSLLAPISSNVRSLNDLKEKKIATQRGSLYQTILEERGFALVLYETEADALIALSKGEADAYAGSEKTAIFNIRKYDLKGIHPVSTPLRVSSVYFVIRKGDTELQSLIDKGMERIRRDGTYNTLYRKWFVEELDGQEIKTMKAKARETSHFAYAPYSNFYVGAAVLTTSGKIFTGCNVENALFGYTTSALKVAINKAVSEGETHFRAVLNIFPDGKIAAPAPDERQILYELGMGTLAVIDDACGGYSTATMLELLPYAFQLQ